jgi:hypothetical protein
LSTDSTRCQTEGGKGTTKFEETTTGVMGHEIRGPLAGATHPTVGGRLVAGEAKKGGEIGGWEKMRADEGGRER